MGQVAFTINGRIYRFDCEDEEVERLNRLGEMVTAYVGEFANDFGQVGENRLLLLAALRLADELVEARSKATADTGLAPTALDEADNDRDDVDDATEQSTARS